MEAPERLKNIEIVSILEAISTELNKKRKVMHVFSPYSVYGRAFKVLTGFNSNLDERQYLSKLWRESDHQKVVTNS